MLTLKTEQLRWLSKLSLCVLATLLLTGCPEKRPGVTKVFANRPKSRPSSRPSKKPPFAPFARPKKAAEQNQALPLTLTGHNSIAQLKLEQSRLSESEKKTFEQAYRLVFCVDRSKRDPKTARSLLNQILTAKPKFGPGYRAMAYTHIDQGFNVPEALKWYQQGTKADPTYGLNFYALSFTLAGVQQVEKGFEAFQQAEKLGVKDERNLKQKFFSNFNKGIKTH